MVIKSTLRRDPSYPPINQNKSHVLLCLLCVSELGQISTMAHNLQPLIQILDQILHPQHYRRPNWILDIPAKPIVESLLAKAHFIQDSFENPSSFTRHDVRSLECRIRDSAFQAQYVIESHLADLLLSQTKSGSILISPPCNLLRSIEGEFEHISDEIRKITDESGASSSDLVPLQQDLSTTQRLNPENTVVGINEDVILLKEQLIMPHESKLQIIPIVGMGGIGKTTLARTLYDDESVVSYFDTSAWVVISQSYSEEGILSGILNCFAGNQYGNNDLGSQVHKKLWGRRYLIVLDDMWNFEAWDCISNFFPDENNGSRILVTTREQSVADHVAGSHNLHHPMKFLNETESCSLLRKKVFADEESCPLELEKIADHIAKGCKGLPLAIHVVGGVLSKLGRTKETWLQVAKDVGSSMADNHEQVSNILSLSYNYLPNYLKPCFLYMGALPEDCVIKPSKLIRLWMAEGFIKAISGLSFEETGTAYLKELVDRNLLSVGQQEIKGYMKSYIMHDLLRDLCISKAREEKFLYVGIDAIKDLNLNEMLQLRLSVHDSYDEFARIIVSPYMPSILRSVLLFAKAGEFSWLDKYAFGLLRFLKVLDVLEVNFAESPKAVESLVSLRYLAARISNSGPYSISNLCNLQSLIIHLEDCDTFVGKVKELLEMPQLRHIKFGGDIYPLFILEDGESIDVVNEELQTLSMVQIDDSFPRILKAIPNLKKLGIRLHHTTISPAIDLSSSSQLQILKCSWPWLITTDFHLIFPPSLRKLTLYHCRCIPIGLLNEIGRLPNLQVFKVKHCLLSRHSHWEWKPTEGEFQQLRLLQLEYFRGLKKWIVDDETHYPRLEHLIITGFSELEEIPTAIGHIPTLEIIEVKGELLSTSLLESAKRIEEEQIQYGNDTFLLRISVLPPVAALLMYMDQLRDLIDKQKM